jgi:hypothetical protein
MTEVKIDDFILDNIARGYAEEILKQTQDMDEASNLAHQYADGSEWVIYHDKAHMLCLYCNTDGGEEFVDDCYASERMTYDQMGSALAYGEIFHRTLLAINDLELLTHYTQKK